MEEDKHMDSADLSSDFGDPEIRQLVVQENDDDEMEVEGEEDKEEKKEKKRRGRGHPAALWTASVVTLNDKKPQVYVFGGAPRVKTGEIVGVSVYDVHSRTWLPSRTNTCDLAFANQRRWGHTATLCPQGSSSLYLIGGWDNQCQYGDVILYDTKTNKLQDVGVSGLSARAGHSAVCVESRIYVFGGAICKGGPYHYYNDTLCFDTKSKTWTTLTVGDDAPTPRSQHSCVALGDSYLVIIGGYTGKTLLNDVWMLDLKLARWKRLTVTSEENGPKTVTGLTESEFRVRPATHTSILLNWDMKSKVGQVLVTGLCASNSVFLLSISSQKGTMEWKKGQSSPATALMAHSYVSFPNTTDKGKDKGITVVQFGGFLSPETTSENESGERTYSYLRTFNIN